MNLNSVYRVVVNITNSRCVVVFTNILILFFYILSGNAISAGTTPEITKIQKINVLSDYYRGIIGEDVLNQYISDEEKKALKDAAIKKATDASNTNDVVSYLVFTPTIGMTSIFMGAQFFFKNINKDTESNTFWWRYFNAAFGIRVHEFADQELQNKYNGGGFYFGLGYSLSDSFSVTAGSAWFEKKDHAGFKPNLGLGLTISLDQILEWKSASSINK